MCGYISCVTIRGAARFVRAIYNGITSSSTRFSDFPALPKFNPIHLREWRKAKGLTLIELAQLADLDHGNLSKLERGIYPYSQGVLEKLALVLGVSPAAILSLTPSEAARIEAEIASLGDEFAPTMTAAWQKICKSHKNS